MRKLQTTIIALVSVLTFSFATQAAPMSPYMENALVDVCKAAMSNKIHQLNKTTKAYRLKDKTIALKVVCNGDDIITFAERHGADKTAAKLQRSIGSVSIIDVAETTKSTVTMTQ